jgi:hypothetical protein
VNKLKFALVIMVCFCGLTARALVTELGLSYGYSKKTFNASNYYQNESKSASLSFYFLEKFALEFSYTDSFYEGEESDTTSTRTVQQSSQYTDSSLIYVVTSKQSAIQPYIKGGAAHIKKNQTIRYQNASAISIPESTGWAPSYGVGLKVQVTEKFGLKFSYDLWKTPLSDGTNSDDTSFKAGMTWYL